MIKKCSQNINIYCLCFYFTTLHHFLFGLFVLKSSSCSAESKLFSIIWFHMRYNYPTIHLMPYLFREPAAEIISTIYMLMTVVPNRVDPDLPWRPLAGACGGLRHRRTLGSLMVAVPPTVNPVRFKGITQKMESPGRREWGRFKETGDNSECSATCQCLGRLLQLQRVLLGLVEMFSEQANHPHVTWPLT